MRRSGSRRWRRPPRRSRPTCGDPGRRRTDENRDKRRRPRQERARLDRPRRDRQGADRQAPAVGPRGEPPGRTRRRGAEPVQRGLSRRRRCPVPTTGVFAVLAGHDEGRRPSTPRRARLRNDACAPKARAALDSYLAALGAPGPSPGSNDHRRLLVDALDADATCFSARFELAWSSAMTGEMAARASERTAFRLEVDRLRRQRPAERGWASSSAWRRPPWRCTTRHRTRTSGPPSWPVARRRAPRSRTARAVRAGPGGGPALRWPDRGHVSAAFAGRDRTVPRCRFPPRRPAVARRFVAAGAGGPDAGAGLRPRAMGSRRGDHAR